MGLAGLASELLGAKNSTAMFIKIMGSRNVQDDLIDHFNLRERYHLRFWDETRKKLSSRTDIAEDKKSGVISVTVRDHDPKVAVDLAKGYIDELDRVVAQVSTSSARREREFIEQRLSQEKEVLEDAEKQFGHFASNTMTLDVPQQTKVTVEAAAKLQGEMIVARSELEGLEQIYTTENYRVKSLRARVGELERELARINAGPLASANAQDPTNPYPSVKSLPQVGIQWVDLYRNTKIHETVFELLTQQYEMAKIQEAKEIPSVKVLDSPSTPERRYPAPGLIVELGILISGLMGCLSVFLRDRWASWDADDPGRMLIQKVYQSARESAAAALHPFGRWRPGTQHGVREEPETALDQQAHQEEYSDRRS